MPEFRFCTSQNKQTMVKYIFRKFKAKEFDDEKAFEIS